MEQRLFTEEYPHSAVNLLALRGARDLGYSMAATLLSIHIVDILAPGVRLRGIGYSSLTSTPCSVLGPTLAFFILGPDVDRFLLLFTCVLAAGLVALVMAIVSKDAGHATRANRSHGAGVEGGVVPWAAALLPAALFAAMGFAQSASSSLSLFAIDKWFEGIGLYFTLNAVGVFASRFVMGCIVGALGGRLSVAASIALPAASMLGIASAGSTGMLYAVAAPFGFAVGMLWPIVNTHLVAIMPESKSGTTNALFYAAGDVGFITGPVVWGAVAQFTSYEATFVAGCRRGRPYVPRSCSSVGSAASSPSKGKELVGRDKLAQAARES